MYQNLSYEVVKGNIGLLKINRERVLNVLSVETMKELSSFIKEKLPNENINVLIITGEGSKAFVAGADIKQMREMNRIEFREYCELGHSNFNNLQDCNIPVIAAINGYALGGGCELALACDIRVASEKAKLGFPEVKLGLFPCWGGSQRTSRIMGLGKVKELVFTGDMISAVEAEKIGLVDRVVKNEDLMDEVLNMAERICRNSSNAIGYAKEAINTGSEMEIKESLELELNLGVNCFDSNDRLEGMSAFLDKREPKFTGN